MHLDEQQPRPFPVVGFTRGGGGSTSSRRPASSISVSVGQLNSPVVARTISPPARQGKFLAAQASSPQGIVQCRTGVSSPRRDLSPVPPPLGVIAAVHGAAAQARSRPGIGALTTVPRRVGPTSTSVSLPFAASERLASQMPMRTNGLLERPREASPMAKEAQIRTWSPSASAAQHKHEEAKGFDIHAHTPIYIPMGAHRRAPSPVAATCLQSRGYGASSSRLVEVKQDSARARSASCAASQQSQRFMSLSQEPVSAPGPGRTVAARPAATSVAAPSQPPIALIASQGHRRVQPPL